MSTTPDEFDRRAVPPWAVRLIGDASATKATVEQIAPVVTETRQKIEGLVTRDEYNSRHNEVVEKVSKLEAERVNPLWDAHQQTAGEVRAQARSSRAWRYGFTAAIALLTLWVAFHTGHVNISF